MSRLLFLILLFSLHAGLAFAQQEEADSTGTPFRKGRWLTGLSGGISSSSTRLDTASNRAFGNQYAFDFSTGKFFKDRWLTGGIFRMERDNSRQFVDLESESLLIAPLLSYYISESNQGSIFFLVAPGYARFKEKTVVLIAGTPSQEILEGGGFGLVAQLGYSYVLQDHIVFDLKLGLTNTWINGRRVVDGTRSSRKTDIHIGSVIFSFGFNVVLDQFFF
jgi:hypothetical protein